MDKRFIVKLTENETRELVDILNKGRHPAQKRKRAHALLLAHEGDKTDKEIAQIVRMNDQSVTELRKRFVRLGFDLTLNSRPHKRRPKAIDDANEARLLDLVAEERQAGKPQWSLRRLAKKFVTSDGRRVSYETIRQALKKNASATTAGSGQRLDAGTSLS
ncbi:MAG: helix-turn-helix domain-containing protein [Deltaproteobacteria bacterium]|jgi:transposase|nr:helix-turn-helix domain-containing protein [Deltaproteobacteria bacterium]